MTRRLEGKWAVITGASSGIGEEYARQLSTLGANLILAARRRDRLDKVAREVVSKNGVQVSILEVDLGVEGASDRLAKFSFEKSRRIHILINNAGIGKFAPFLKKSLEDHQKTIHLNVRTLTDLSYLFAHKMLQNGEESYITNISSVAGFVSVPHYAVYSGTKSYVVEFSKILGYELKGSRVSVTCVCPGGTYTEFLDQAGQDLTEFGRRGMMKTEDVVRVGIKGMLGKRAIVIPGFTNKLLCLLPRFLPHSLLLSIADRSMSASVKMRDF